MSDQDFTGDYDMVGKPEFKGRKIKAEEFLRKAYRIDLGLSLTEYFEGFVGFSVHDVVKLMNNFHDYNVGELKAENTGLKIQLRALQDAVNELIDDN